MKYVLDQTVLQYGRFAMTRYGKSVIEERALPDFRDGLKPVQRRVLWAANEFPKNQLVKTARLTGLVIGKYHPHGESGPNGAIETMMHLPQSPLFGEGNWGTMVDGAAAARYTNLHLSGYGYTFFDKHLLAVTDCVLNYDDKDWEPVVINASLPNLLFNGASGIAVGTTCNIPQFEPISVLQLCVRLLRGEHLEAKDWLSLKVISQWGGRVLKIKENKAEMLNLIKTGRGRLTFGCDLQEDEAKHLILWSKFGPSINPDKVGDKIKALPGVENFRNATDKKLGRLTYEIRVKRSIKGQDWADLVSKIKKLMISRDSYIINVTERIKEDDSNVDVKFHSLNIPDLFKMWLKWRVKTEVRSLKKRHENISADIAYTKLLRYAISKLDIVFGALKTKDPQPYLVKHLKITEAEADKILSLQVRQLSRLSDDDLLDRLNKQEHVREELEGWLAKPVQHTADELEAAMELFK